MLAVILTGILALIFTHIQANRQLRNCKDPPLIMHHHQLMVQYKGNWLRDFKLAERTPRVRASI